jgi:hypothetical protein
VVVDDSLGLPGRGLAGQDARAQARGHGQQADGFQVRVHLGGRVAGGLGGSQYATLAVTAARADDSASA